MSVVEETSIRHTDISEYATVEHLAVSFNAVVFQSHCHSLCCFVSSCMHKAHSLIINYLVFWTLSPFCVSFEWCIHGVSKSFRTGRLERELQMVQLSDTRYSCIAILWVSLVSFATVTLCVASQRVFIVDFVIDPVRKLLATPSHVADLLLSGL
jgi:hypothetical protein